MKTQNIVILALLGLVSVNAIQYRPDAKQSPWAAPAADPVFPGFRLPDSGSVFYDRKVPNNFSAEGDDRLMNSLISKYSIEGNDEGKPSGHFYLDWTAASDVAKEVV